MSLPKGKWLALALLLLAAGAGLAGLLVRAGSIDEPVISRTTSAAAAPPKSELQLGSGWQERRGLPELAHDMWTQQSAGRTEAIREAPSAAPAQPPQPPAMPYTYVGKGRDAAGRFAVLGKGDRVHVIRPADVVEGAYRVESIGEDRVVLTYLALGTRETLLFPGAGGGDASAADPLAPAPAGEEATLRVTGPRQAAIGEEFTLMVDVDAGRVGILQDGNVELYYDTKVLRREISGVAQSPDSGTVRVDISGSHIGHSAATAVQFRVAATAPTTTEIRIVPLDVADTEGRNVAVTGPERYRLSVVAAPAK